MVSELEKFFARLAEEIAVGPEFTYVIPQPAYILWILKNMDVALVQSLDNETIK